MGVSVTGVDKLQTPTCRLSYCYLVNPSINDNGEKEYRTTLLIPKDAKGTNLVVDAIEKAKTMGKSEIKSWKGKFIEGSYKNVLLDGDSEQFEDAEECHGHWVLRVKAPKGKLAFFKVENGKAVAFDETDNLEDYFYSGAYVRASIGTFAYDNNSKGVSASIKGIVFVKNGDPLSGGATKASADDFDVTDVEDFEDDDL